MNRGQPYQDSQRPFTTSLDSIRLDELDGTLFMLDPLDQALSSLAQLLYL